MGGGNLFHSESWSENKRKVSVTIDSPKKIPGRKPDQWGPLFLKFPTFVDMTDN